MIRRLIFIIAMLLGVAALQAQKAPGRAPHCPWSKEFKEFKMKFLAQEMGLKEDQQQKSLDLYAQMMSEKNKVMKEAFDMKREVENKKNATDADYKAASDALTDARIKDSQIEKKYDDKFATFLSQRQIFKMKEAEQKFRDRLSKMRHQRKQKKTMRKTPMKRR